MPAPYGPLVSFKFKACVPINLTTLSSVKDAGSYTDNFVKQLEKIIAQLEKIIAMKVNWQLTIEVH